MTHRYIAAPLLALLCLSGQAQGGLRVPGTAHAHQAALGGGAPVNDLCSSVTPQALTVAGPLVFTGTTVGATITDDFTPGSTLEGFGAPVVWHAFSTTACSNIKVEYCGTPSIFSEFWNVLSLDCPATNDLVVAQSYNSTDCPDGNPTVYFIDVPVGTYYYPVWAEDPGANGEYELHISATACSGGPTTPVNDECASVTPQALAANAALTFTGDNTNATATGDFAPGSDFAGSPVVWHAFTTVECTDVTVSYCGQTPTWDNTFGFLSIDCPSDSVVFFSTLEDTSCTDGNTTYHFVDLAAGTYYLPVLYDVAHNAAGPYSIEVAAVACATGPVGPVNDDCTSVTPEALDVDATLTFTGDNTGATASGDFAPGSPFAGTPVVWHAFTTTECTNVTVSYCGQAPAWDNALGILSVDCPSDSVIFFTLEDTCADGNFIYHFDDLAAGTYYLPVIFDPAHNAEGPYSIEVAALECNSGPVGPVNDDCASVTPQALNTGTSVVFTGDNTGATATGDFTPGSPFSGTPVVWHAFTTTACSNVTVSYCAQTPAWDNTLGILSVDCPSDSVVFFTTLDDTTCTNGNVIYGFDALAPGTYYLPVLFDPANNAAGPYDIVVRATACDGVVPVNDTCSFVVAQELTVGGAPLTLQGDNTNATDSEGLGYASVWEGFTITECAQVIVQYCGTAPAFGTISQEIYTSCPPVDPIVATSTLTEACGFGDSNVSLVYDNLAPGTYYVPVLMEAGIAEGAYRLTLSAAACNIPPANDECADAQSVEVVLPLGCDTASVEGDNTTATQGGTEPTCGFPGSPVQDVWYSFNSGDNVEVTIAIIAGTIVGQGIEVYPTCDDNSIYCSIADEAHVVIVEPQTEYLVRVYSFSDLGEAGTFSICVQGSPGTGMADATAQDFGVFPNPTDGDMTVVYSGEAADATIQLFDLSGRTVHTERTHLVNGQQRTLGLSGTLAAGTYALRITTAFGRSEQRVVIK